ncbi:unnamed protein product [Aspergillus oryzae]|uniref:Unnamed protein product n=2 Tax=Aspergillus oryzae TaxID=5062 RepID=A0AAN4YKP5_ASPOZ|nr:unnamed protein product [Aspergillus oryzae]GMF92784.1 unnamed protein product [Aspergillus oryzae]GMG29602.1 unnamed protein product [Aspergillus oryzae]GMG49536.1 unnamed protein product [Aspergillus oryzae var. brunneus]
MTNCSRRESIPFIETPIDGNHGTRLHRHFDATPIELFFDLFFVANLSTFTATHEIHNVEALGAYIGFLGVIWFTWLQVTLFDIRFARDSVFERICKALQLAAMVGFASAGTRFTTRVNDENVWAFQSLSLFLGGSRILLALQYTVNNVVFIRKRMKPAAKGVSIIAATLFVSSLIYLGYFLWQAYYDLSPRGILGKYSQQLWAQLHFPFHVALVLLLEGSQILALTLDITLKLTYLEETIMFACEEPRPRPEIAIGLLRNTIEDMEINYSRGAIKEKMAIDAILEDLPNHPLCPGEKVIAFFVTNDHLNDLVGNVTAALFSSMGIIPSEETNIGQLTSSQLLRMYMQLLGFVYIYFFVVASLVMFLFAAFAVLARRHNFYTSIGITTRIILGVLLASLVSFVGKFALAWAIHLGLASVFSSVLIITVSGVDRLLDLYKSHHETNVNLADAGKRSQSDTP